MKQKSLGIFLILLSLTGTNIGSEEMLSNNLEFIESFQSIDPYINKALEVFNVPGAALGVVIDNKIALIRGYGTRQVAKDSPVTEKTLFRIASCTKAFTSLMLGQLVDEGKISWDDPVIKYIPEFRLYDQKLTSEVTVRDLVAHRTGLARHDAIWIYSIISKSDVLNLLPYLKPDHGLREKYQYNNFMYAVAGIVIEKVSGQTWEDMLRSQILIPLEMISSNTSIDAMRTCHDFSSPHAEIDGIVETLSFSYLPAMSPAGGINSNVSDMTRWIQLQFSEGMFSNQRIISPETLQETHSMQMPFPSTINPQNENIQQLGYGLGWELGTIKGFPFVKHGGDIDGFTSEVFMLPQQKIGLVILTNSSTDGRYVIMSIRNMIVDKLNGTEATDWISKELEIRTKAKQTIQDDKQTNPSVEMLQSLGNYEGIYENEAYSKVQVYLTESNLFLEYGEMVSPLTPISNGIFTGKFRKLQHYGINPTIEISFISDSSGNISGLLIPFEAFRSTKPIEFRKQCD